MILWSYRNLTREHEIEASEDLGETIIGNISLSDITKSQPLMYVKKVYENFNKCGKSVVLRCLNYVQRTTNIKNNINDRMTTSLNPQKLK